MEVPSDMISVPESNLFPEPKDYIKLLSHFPLYGEKGWKSNYRGDSSLGYFGDPGSGENGLRTMGNYIFTASLLATDSDYDQTLSGVSQETLLERAKCCLRYMVRSHVTGDIPCADGGRWGGAWQSSWWTTKMALGARFIWPYLSRMEQTDVERVITFEASRHLSRVFPTGCFQDTKAEENAWDNEILATAIAMFPEHPDCPQWSQKLVELALNTLSVPQDLTSEAIVDSLLLKEHVYTANLHSDFTIENHGAYHFCYVASPLISITWSYYALLSSQQPIPEALLHHVDHFWETVKSTFLSQRFAYISGKEWARYTYGLYFIVPVLVLIQAVFHDVDARFIEVERFKTLSEEHKENNDGSFYGKRVTHSQMFGQSAKYETDCYADLGLAYLLHRLLGTGKQAPPKDEFLEHIQGRLVSPEAGIAYIRTPKIFASFSWRTLEFAYPIALFIPEGMDSAAEWAINNLIGQIKVKQVHRTTGICSMKRVDSGFQVQGSLSYWSLRKELYIHQLYYQVIPEHHLAIVESRFSARSPIQVQETEGLRLAIANDYFNHYQRQFYWSGSSQTVTFDPNASQAKGQSGFIGRVYRKLVKIADLNISNLNMSSSWVNIDDRLGIIQLRPASTPFNLRQEPGRNTVRQCLHYDVLNNPQKNRKTRSFKTDEVILHTRFLLLAGSRAETENLAQSMAIDAYRLPTFS